MIFMFVSPQATGIYRLIHFNQYSFLWRKEVLRIAAYESDPSAGHQLLDPLGLGPGIVSAVTFHEVDATPDGEPCALGECVTKIADLLFFVDLKRATPCITEMAPKVALYSCYEIKCGVLGSIP